MNTLTLLNDVKYFDEANPKFAELRQMLDSRQVRFLEALIPMFSGKRQIRSDETVACNDVPGLFIHLGFEKHVLGRDVASFFPDVVKCVVVDSQEVKKLVSQGESIY